MNVLSLLSLLYLLHFGLQFRLLLIHTITPLLIHNISLLLNSANLHLFLLFLLQLFCFFVLACFFSEEAAFFDPGRSSKAEAPG